MEPEELLGLLAQTTVARLLERDDFQQRMAAGGADLRARAPLSAAPGLRLGGDRGRRRARRAPTRSSTCSSAATSRAPTAVEPQSILTMPILPGTDGVQRMSKSPGNYVGVTEPPEEMFGKVMSLPDEAMPIYYRLVLGTRARRRPGAEPGQAGAGPRHRRALPRRGAGRGRRGALRPPLRPPRGARRRSRRRRSPPARRGPPAGPAGRAFRDQPQRGQAPDRPGRREDRRRGRWRRSASISPLPSSTAG